MMINLKESIGVFAQHTGKDTKAIARTFYEELKKDGFSSQEVIRVASNLLGNLIENFHTYNSTSNLNKNID